MSGKGYNGFLCVNIHYYVYCCLLLSGYLLSYTLYRIGKKFQIGSFLGYCIPIYNMYLIYKCADVPLWNFIGLFIPILNIYCCVNIWGSIAERLGKNYWLYGITIIYFSFPYLFLLLIVPILSGMTPSMIALDRLNNMMR